MLRIKCIQERCGGIGNHPIAFAFHLLVHMDECEWLHGPKTTEDLVIFTLSYLTLLIQIMSAEKSQKLRWDHGNSVCLLGQGLENLCMVLHMVGYCSSKSPVELSSPLQFPLAHKSLESCFSLIAGIQR